MVVKIHLCCPLEGGWIYPMKSKPHCWKGIFSIIGFKGRERNFCFPTNNGKQHRIKLSHVLPKRFGDHFQSNFMINYFSIKNINILIRPCKNINKFLNRFNIYAYLLIRQCFGQFHNLWICNSPNITVKNVIFLNLK